MALPYGALGWSSVCDCGISLSYSLIYLVNKNKAVALNREPDGPLVSCFSLRKKRLRNN